MKKRMQRILARYGVVLRADSTKVWHPVYATWTETTPEQFAFYECAIKAVDAHYQALIRERHVPPVRAGVQRLVMTADGGCVNSSTWDAAAWVESYEGYRTGHREIADRDGFALADVKIDKSLALEDYQACVRELGGLAIDLLD